MSALLAAICGLLVLAAARELWAEHRATVASSLRRRAARLAGRLPADRHQLGAGSRSALRLRRAGLERLDPRLLHLARAVACLSAIPLALTLAPIGPGRTGALIVFGVPALAGLLPDLAVERVARTRLGRIAAALPDSLELMAVGAGTGSGARGLLDSAAAGCRPGPLRRELLRARAEIECGHGSEQVLRGLGRRAGGEVAALAQLLDRSRRLGSPLAAGLQEQAVGLRERQAREIEERAARAAPKIQLIVALLLVPSVLLLVAAAILANAEALLGGL